MVVQSLCLRARKCMMRSRSTTLLNGGHRGLGSRRSESSVWLAMKSIKRIASSISTEWSCSRDDGRGIIDEFGLLARHSVYYSQVEVRFSNDKHIPACSGQCSGRASVFKHYMEAFTPDHHSILCIVQYQLELELLDQRQELDRVRAAQVSAARRYSATPSRQSFLC